MHRDATLRRKRRAAALSVVSNTLLVGGKLVVGLLTGSVAVISEAIHSGMDLLASLIALAAVTLSGKPPDESHPHGHGKIEDLSGAIEALLIFGAVVIIGYEAIHRLRTGGEVQQAYLGSIVMGVSAVVNIAVSWYLQKVGRETDSAALLADAAHLRTDVYTSAGVLVGLLLVHFTGLHWLDPAVALAVGLLIVGEAWQITRRSVGELLDEGLPAEELETLEQVLSRLGVRYHALRTRKSGPTRTIDLHLEVSPEDPVETVHALCDLIEAQVRAALPGAQVLIHPEPFMPADQSRDARGVIDAVLAHHRHLFVEAGEPCIFYKDGKTNMAFHLTLRPDLSLAQADGIARHLTTHIHEHLPGSIVFVHPRPVAGQGQDGHAESTDIDST